MPSFIVTLRAILQSRLRPFSLALRGLRLALRPRPISFPRRLTTTATDLPVAGSPKPAPAHALHVHAPRPHAVRNANAVHATEHAEGGVNERLAVWITAHVGTMITAYVFLGIGLGSLVGVLTGSAVLAGVFGSVSSYILQLVLLPILQLGSNLIGRKAEIQAEEMYKGVLNSEHDAEQVMRHLTAQDAELVRQTQLLMRLVERLGDDGAHDTPASATDTTPTSKPASTKAGRRSPARQPGTPPPAAD